MKEMMQTHFEKLLLAAMFIISMCFTSHAMHHNSDMSSIQWFQNITGQIIAAMLTLMVGQRLAQRNNDKNGSGSAAPEGDKSVIQVSGK